MSFPKLHHYVPRFYLQRFADAKQRLWIFDKQTKRIFPTAPDRIAAESHFYKVPELIGTEHDPLFLENNLSRLESVAAPLISRLLDEAVRLPPLAPLTLTSDERDLLSYYIAVQFFRTLEQREILALFVQVYEKSDLPIDAEEKINLHARMLCGDLAQTFAEKIAKSVWLFGVNKSSTPFITSDNPVCVKTEDHRMWLKGPGVLSAGSYVVFPLSPTVVLYCHDGDFGEKIRTMDGTLSPVEFTTGLVDQDNTGQAFMASRFLISSSDNFDRVREFLPSVGTDLYSNWERNEEQTDGQS